MTYYAESNYIEYDEWFDATIDPIDLIYYSNEINLTDSVHKKFYQLSSKNLTIGSSNNYSC